MNHDEVAFLLAVGYSLSEIMHMAAERAQRATGAAQEAAGAAGEAIENLRRENESLKKQIQEMNRKNAVFEQAKEKTLDEILFKIMEEYK